VATGIVLALLGLFVVLRTVRGKRKLPALILGS
jgi:hypothetical protein